MDRKIRITAGDVQAEAGLWESPTAGLLWDALPLTGRANLWGEEIYFEIPIDAPAEPGAREEMAVGEIAFWPPGKAFCIFFGPTPASPVNPLGKTMGDPKQFMGVPSGAEIRIERSR